MNSEQPLNESELGVLLDLAMRALQDRSTADIESLKWAARKLQYQMEALK